MTIFAAVIAFLQAFIPMAVSLGTSLGSLIPVVKTVWNDFATANGATQADYDAFDAMIKLYDDDLQKQSDAAQAEVNTSAATVSSGATVSVTS